MSVERRVEAPGGRRDPDGTFDGWPDAVRRARALVLACGWNATAYQIVNPGIQHWFAEAGDAVVGYVRHAGTRVVAGAPVCAAERLAAVVEEFEKDCTRRGDDVCYFGAEARLEGVLGRSPHHALLALGAQPAWRPRAFTEATRARASLRAQLNRARNKGVAVEEWHPGETGAASEWPLLSGALAAWLSTRGLPPLHFLVEPDTLDRLADRRVFVARQGGVPAAFVVASPVPARQGWLVEQFVRVPAAVNGTIELLLDSAVRAMAEDGAEYVTLGLAPLSRHGPGHAAAPGWLRVLLGIVRAHGRRFYNFDGLDAFKAKFQPERWEPVFAIARVGRAGATFPPRALWAIAGAFAGRSPAALMAHALVRAAAQEARWLATGATGAFAAAPGGRRRHAR